MLIQLFYHITDCGEHLPACFLIFNFVRRHFLGRVDTTLLLHFLKKIRAGRVLRDTRVLIFQPSALVKSAAGQFSPEIKVIFHYLHPSRLPPLVEVHEPLPPKG